jgi:Mn-dependent DtxR family transcriptional regulator
MDPISKEIIRREEEKSIKLKPKSTELNRRLKGLSKNIEVFLHISGDFKEAESKKAQDLKLDV